MLLGEPFEVKIEGGYEIDLPKMIKIKQIFPRERVADIKQTVAQEMSAKLIPGEYKGKKIAVAVGSRGIANLAEIVKCVIAELKAWGAEPFIVPAMGSHGGATAEGQREVLDEYAVNEQTMGVPVISSMEVVQIANLENGMPVYFDQAAYQADGVVVVNRIKPHTDFKGDYESGLIKMMTIGLGKHKGATTIHTYGFDRFHELIPETGKAVLQNAPIAFGVGIVENAYDETMSVTVMPKDQIFENEKQLLMVAKKSMPRLLVSGIDVLIVDQIGKDISGAGMDPNITGRTASGLPGFDLAPPIQKVVVLDLTDKTHGNANGIGLADVTTRNLLNKIDFLKLYANSITSTELDPAKIPVVMNSDKEAIVVALKTCNRITADKAKIVRIKNTLDLSEIQVSESYRQELVQRSDVEIVSEAENFSFTKEGRLL